MLCPDCGCDNIDGVEECEECGQSLVQFDAAGSELEQSISRHPISVLSPREPLTLPATTTVREAISAMMKQKVGCMLVVDDGQLVGVFSERDVLNKVAQDVERLKRPISDYMTRSVTTIKNEDSIAYALHAMDVGGYRHMPIVGSSGRPTGIISVRDILRFLCVKFAQLRRDVR